MASKLEEYKILVVGDSGIGKTNFVNTFAKGRHAYSDVYITTVGKSFSTFDYVSNLHSMYLGLMISLCSAWNHTHLMTHVCMARQLTHSMSNKPTWHIAGCPMNIQYLHLGMITGIS